MSGFTTTAANNVLLLLFNATTFNNYAEDDTTSPLTALHVAMHNGDPAAGTMLTDEPTTGASGEWEDYARVSTNRSTTAVGWDVASAQADNDGAVTFPQAGATSTGFSIGWVSVGNTSDDVILVSGTLTATMENNAGITVSFADAALVVTLT